MSQKLIFPALKDASASVKTRCLIRCIYIYKMAQGRVRVMAVIRGCDGPGMEDFCPPPVCIRPQS
jgi:hypothetical protein